MNESPQSHDPITGLDNKSTLEQSLQRRIDDPDTVALGGFSLLLFSVAGQTSDQGANPGALAPESLKHIGAELKHAMRDSDFLAHCENGVFGLILPQLAEVEEVDLVAAKVFRVLDLKINGGGGNPALITRMGIARYPIDGRDAQLLLSRAYQAMEEVQPQGEGEAGQDKTSRIRYFSKG